MCLRKILIKWWPQRVRNQTISETKGVNTKMELDWICAQNGEQKLLHGGDGVAARRKKEKE